MKKENSKSYGEMLRENERAKDKALLCKVMPKETKDLEENINDLIPLDKWALQGRTDEQIWAVQNFLTGAGRNLVDKEKLVKGIERMKDNDNFYKQDIITVGQWGSYKRACDDIIKLIK